MPKVHKTCIYSKKSKVLIVKSHQTCIYSKKIKKNKNLRLYVGLTGIDEFVFDFFDFFEYMQVWWLFTIKTFDFFEYMHVVCTFGIKMLFFWVYAGSGAFPYQNVCFLWVYAGLRDFRFTKPAYTQKNQGVDSEKSPNLHILKKKTSQTLCCIDELVFDFLDSFEYMQVLCALLASKCWSFLSICRFWAVPYQNVCFFVYMQVWGTWGSPNLHILKKNQHFDAKSAQNLHILKKIKSFDSEKSPNLHILKKIKKIKNLRLYVGLTGIDELVFGSFLIFLSICRFGDFSLSKLLIFLSICRFCALLASKCWFFLSMRVWWTSSLSNLHFCNQKQKRRIDTLDMFFLFDNFPDAKEIHKMFKYNETQTLHWKQLRKTLDMELYHLTKSLMQTFRWKQLFILKGRPWGGG